MEKILLENAVKTSTSINQVLIKLGKNTGSGNYKWFAKQKFELNLDTTHFLTCGEINKQYYQNGGKPGKRYSFDTMFTENSLINRSVVKHRILTDKLIPYICQLCGQDDVWNGVTISLILDHINGINTDHRLKNLRFVCPNCNATLPTFCTGTHIKPKKLINDWVQNYQIL